MLWILSWTQLKHIFSNRAREYDIQGFFGEVITFNSENVEDTEFLAPIGQK